MTKVEVKPGICGFTTLVELVSEDLQNVALNINTTCPNLKPIEKELKEVDAFQECFAKVGESGIYETIRPYCKHAACPVPMAIIKGVEVVCNLALPREVVVNITK